MHVVSACSTFGICIKPLLRHANVDTPAREKVIGRRREPALGIGARVHYDPIGLVHRRTQVPPAPRLQREQPREVWPSVALALALRIFFRLDRIRFLKLHRTPTSTRGLLVCTVVFSSTCTVV